MNEHYIITQQSNTLLSGNNGTITIADFRILEATFAELTA